MTITSLVLPYPDFKLQEVIDPDQFDLNNQSISTKMNEISTAVNSNTTSITAKSDKSYVDTQDTGLQTQITSNKTADDARHASLLDRMTSAETSLTTKATTSYVDTQVALIQSGYIVDNSITTVKIVDRSVTTGKLADLAVNASKVDGTTVYTASQVNGKVSTDIATAKSDLQTKIDTNVTGISSLTTNLATTNTRIDNLLYNKDLYSAKQDIVTLSLNVEIVKGSQLTGVSQNMIIETLVDVSDLTITSGVYDSVNRKVYLP